MNPRTRTILMYLDEAQTTPYEKHRQRAAQEFQDAQYDAALVKHWVGSRFVWLGGQLTVWGQRLLAGPRAAANQLGY